MLPDFLQRLDVACKTDPRLAELDETERVAVFYPHQGDPTRLPRDICSTCPVLDECREYGILHEYQGIWGGLSGRERRRLRSERGIVVITPEAQAFKAEVQACGSNHGYLRHKRDGEEVCWRCQDAHERHTAYRRKVAS